MRTYSIAALVLLLAGTAVPAAAQNKEHMQMEAELRIMQEKSELLSLALQQAMEAIKAQNGRFDAVMDAMRKNQADLANALKGISSDVSAMQERSGDTDRRLRTIGDDVKNLQTTVTALGNALVQASAQGAIQTGAIDPNAPAGGPAPVAPNPISIPTLGMNAGRMFDQARGDYFRSDYPTAILGFEALIKQFPDTEYAAEAQFWIGESQYQQKKWTEAIAAYRQVLAKSPRASYAADAAYKLGEAQNAAGDAVAAKASWELAVRQYANTPAAGLAQQHLDGLARQNQNTPAKR